MGLPHIPMSLVTKDIMKCYRESHVHMARTQNCPAAVTEPKSQRNEAREWFSASMLLTSL
jgi:hypothetical protein